MAENNGPYHRLGEPGGPGCAVAILPVNFTDEKGRRHDEELLDAGTHSTELELLRTVASRLGARWGHDEFGWWAATTVTANKDSSVWRQDDNGNRFLIESGLTEGQARNLVDNFEASAHKQTYWATENEES